MLTIEMEHFDLAQICDSGQCFRMKKLDDNRFCVIAADMYTEITQEGSLITFHCPEEEFLCFWISYFDLDADYQKYADQINPRDKYLTAAAREGSGIRILRQDLWEMIVTFLISQQNNIPRIRRCIETLCQNYGEEKTSASGVVYHAFPSPGSLASASEVEFRACGLGYRAKYIYQTACDVAEGRVCLEPLYSMSFKKARTELMKLCGVGEKVADCICLFSLHHLDAFPVDTHIRQVLDMHYKRGFPNRRYKGMRGVMQQYIFYHELISK